MWQIEFWRIFLVGLTKKNVIKQSQSFERYKAFYLLKHIDQNVDSAYAGI